jgi:Ca2+-binding EF-hand superfamily protein
MKLKMIATTLAAATMLCAAGSALAQTRGEFYPLAEIMSMKMMDKNHDGMVSKKEYMDMMSLAWDMNAKKMGVKGDKMTTEQFDQVLQYLKAGG